MSQRSTEIKVGIFLVIAMVLGAIMTFIIGKANQTFEKQVFLHSTFARVSGLAIGSQVRLSGRKIGVVVKIEFSRKFEKSLFKTKLARDWEAYKKSCLKFRRRCWRNKAYCKKYEVKCQIFRKNCRTLENACDRDETKCITYRRRCNQTKHKYLHVAMKVTNKSLPWIREDSIATVEGKGLLGDALINITIGAGKTPIKENGWVRGITPKNMADFMDDAGKMMDRVKNSLKSIDLILKEYKDPRLASDLKGIVSSVNGLLARAKTGPGLMHDLFYSRILSRQLHRILYQVEKAGKNLAASIKQLEWLLRRIQRPGRLIHKLFLSKKSAVLANDIKRLIRNTRQTMASVNRIAKAPQQKGSLLYKLLYDKKTATLLVNLTKASKDIQTMIHDIRKGKGSLGAVLNDPTAFEDFKTILGQIKRSRIFRSMIRFIIKRDDSSVRQAGRVLNNGR